MATSPCSSTSSSSAAAARVTRSSSPAVARVARSSSPAAAVAVAVAGTNKKMTCLCSPTNHPGSFRCSRHRNGAAAAPGGGVEAGVHGGGSRGAGTGRAAKGRSVRALLLQRIGGGGGPGELGHRRRRRRGVADFQPRPSRLRLMNL